MSKIATYALADTPLQLSDRLIGTEAPRPVPSRTPLATKNFSLGELLQLFSANFPAATLQAVLNAGNTATQNITLTGTIDATLIKPDNIEDTSGSQGLTFQFLSKGATSINWVDLPVSNLQSVLDAGNTATQNITIVGNITSTKIIPGNIQDDTAGIGTTGQILSKTASGIRWINSPTSTTPTLGDVVSVGDTANQDIYINGLRIGRGAGNSLYNTAIGATVLANNTSGNYNTSIGAQSLRDNIGGNYNTANGYASLRNNLSGNYNVAVGLLSSPISTTGASNTSIGTYSLYRNLVGSFNTAVGYRVLENNVADKNTAIGAETMNSNTSGTFNTAVGQEALRANTTGNYNVAIGNFSLLNSLSNYVSALGRDAGRYSSAGNLNTATESIFIGYSSKSLNTSSTNEIVIGANAVGEGNNTVTLGSSAITSTRLRGAVKGGSFVKDGGTSSQFLMADGSVTTGGSQDLNSVLTVGNSSLLDANIGSALGLYDFAGSGYSKITTNDKTFYFTDYNGDYVFRVEPRGLTIFESPVIEATIRTTSLTATRVFQLPNASGTIALTSDPAPTLDQVLSAGNISILPASIGTLNIWDIDENAYMSMQSSQNYFYATSASGDSLFYFGDGSFFLNKTNFIEARISTDNLTVSQTFDLPDASGTIALTSDIPSLTGYVPYTGATSNLDLGTYTLLSGKFLTGPSASANFTRFPNALSVISNVPLGVQHNESLYIGLMSEGLSVGSTWASGIYGAGYTNSTGTGRGTGVTGEGHVGTAADTGVAVGVRGYATDTHTGNYNIGLYGDAENGDAGLTYGGNVSLFLANGNIVTSSAAPKTWYLGGNITFDGQGTSKVIGVTNGASFALGTVTSGIWNATAIADAYIASAATWNAKFTLPALTSGSVLFSNGTTIAQDNANFFWDDTNNRLGIGIATPDERLHVKGDIKLGTGTSAIERLVCAAGGNMISFDPSSATFEMASGSISSSFGGSNVVSIPSSSLAVGLSLPHPSAQLDLTSTTQGLLTPRMTTAQKNAISSPATGLIVYDTDLLSLYQYNGTAWTAVGGGGGSGTVTSVAALTLGTSGTDLSSTVANPTTTPVITLNVPTASAANRGALSSTDWSTFNSKQNTITLTTTGTSGPATLVGATLNIPQYSGGGGGSTPVKLTSQTLTEGSWTLVGSYYTYAFSNVNIDTTCDVSVTPQNASYLTAYNAQVLPFVDVAAGVATFYSQFPPQDDMVVDIVITQTT